MGMISALRAPSLRWAEVARILVAELLGELKMKGMEVKKVTVTSSALVQPAESLLPGRALGVVRQYWYALLLVESHPLAEKRPLFGHHHLVANNQGWCGQMTDSTQSDVLHRSWSLVHP